MLKRRTLKRPIRTQTQIAAAKTRMFRSQLQRHVAFLRPSRLIRTQQRVPVLKVRRPSAPSQPRRLSQPIRRIPILQRSQMRHPQPMLRTRLPLQRSQKFRSTQIVKIQPPTLPSIPEIDPPVVVSQPSGSFYKNKIDVIRKKHDLFDKGLRKSIVEKKYHGEWELDIEQYTVPEWKDLKIPTISDDVLELKWPTELNPMFVLSLRPERYEAFLDRMKHWRNKVELFPATDGRKINLDYWRRQGRLNSDRNNGEVGCYESHCRMWKKIVHENIPHALIIEDDADIRYSPETVDRLEEILSELKTVPDWDIVYIGNFTAIPGHGPLHPFKRQVTPHLFEMSNWEGLHTYYISNRCARKFLDQAFPIRTAVDIYMAEQFSKQNLLALAMVPGLDFVVPNISDTSRFI